MFLPISETGHRALLYNLFGLDVPEGHGVFTLLMHISTLISISLVYRRELSAVLSDGADFLRGRIPDDPVSEGRMSGPMRLLILVVIGTLPLVLSVPFSARIGALTAYTVFVSAAMILTGVILFVSDKLIVTGRRTERTMTGVDALFIGLAQAIALIPGVSRIGVTTSVGLVRGFGKDFSVRFAVFLSLPSVLVSIVVSLFSAFKDGLQLTSFFSYLIGFIVSIAAGYLALQTFRICVRKRKMRYFAVYLFVVGIVMIILNYIV